MFTKYTNFIESNEIPLATLEINRLYAANKDNFSVLAKWGDHLLQMRKGDLVLTELNVRSDKNLNSQDRFLIMDLKRRALFQIREYDQSMNIMRDQIQHAHTNPVPDTKAADLTSFDFSADASIDYVIKLLHGFHTENISATIHGGTLLGLIREGRLLAHDKDIDICVKLSQLREAMNYFFKKNFLLNLEITNYSNFFTFKDPTNDVTIDLMGLKELQDGSVGGYFDRGNLQNWSRLIKYPKLELRKTEFAGEKIYLPKDPDAFLRADYGDWRTPDLDWITFMNAPNLIRETYLNLYLIYSHLLKSIISKNSARTKKITSYVKTLPTYSRYPLLYQ